MKLKDYVTLGNLVCGFLSGIMVIRGELDLACYIIVLAYVFDVLDGPVARLTKQQDKFGGVLDSTCDFVTNSIMPGFIIYLAFVSRAGYPWVLAAMLALVPAIFGTIRHALYEVKNMSYPCYFIGLPRTLITLCTVAMLQSSLFQFGNTLLPHGLAYHLVALMIVVMSVLNLSTFPFASHHGRQFTGWVNFSKWFFLAGTPAALAVGHLLLGAPSLVWDMLAFNMAIYVFVSWMEIPARDFARVRHYVSTGELIKPLVHRDDPWRASGFGNYWKDLPNLPDTATGGEPKTAP